MASDLNEAVVRRFYEELRNEWRLDVAEEIVSSGIRFRGSLGTTVIGREGFTSYGPARSRTRGLLGIPRSFGERSEGST